MKADVLTIGRAKDAALFYEGVLCLIPDEVWVGDETLQRKILESIAPKVIKEPFREFLDAYFSNEMVRRLKASVRDGKLELFELFQIFSDPSLTVCLNNFKSIYNRSQKVGIEAFVSQDKMAKGGEPLPVISLLNIDLVDTKNVSWEAIIELRKDPDAFRKMRQLRQYLNSDMAKKSKDQIRDELLLMIENYKLTAKSHDLTLKQGELHTVIPKFATFPTLCAALFGDPLSWTTLGVSGFCYLFDLGRGKVELAKKDMEFRLAQDLKPVTHLISIDQLGALKP